MNLQVNDLHPEFRLNSHQYTAHSLQELAYDLVKEGEDYEQEIGDFILDWFSSDSRIEVRTSGSTGMPKTIRLRKEMMIHSATSTADYLHLPEGTRALLCLSAQHIAGKMMLVRAMTQGWHLDYTEPSSNPLKSLSASYDFAALVPLQVHSSLDHIEQVTTLIIGGAPVLDDLGRALEKSPSKIFETYGMTETASHIALKPISKAAADHVGATLGVFQVLPGIEISTDSRECLIIEASGWSEEAIVTNDLVKIIDVGQFQWLGRWDNVINSGGIKLYPELIEHKLRPAKGNRFILTGLPDDKLGHKLVLVAEGKGDTKLWLTAIENNEELDNYEKPREIYFLDKLPETPGGKVDRKQILSQLMAQLSESDQSHR